MFHICSTYQPLPTNPRCSMCVFLDVLVAFVRTWVETKPYCSSFFDDTHGEHSWKFPRNMTSKMNKRGSARKYSLPKCQQFLARSFFVHSYRKRSWMKSKHGKPFFCLDHVYWPVRYASGKRVAANCWQTGAISVESLHGSWRLLAEVLRLWM